MVAEINGEVLNMSQAVSPNAQNKSISNLSNNMLAQMNQFNNMSQHSIDMGNDQMNKSLNLSTNFGAEQRLSPMNNSRMPFEGAEAHDARSFGSEGNKINAEIDHQNYVEVQNRSLMEDFAAEGYEPDSPVLPE